MRRVLPAICERSARISSRAPQSRSDRKPGDWPAGSTFLRWNPRFLGKANSRFRARGRHRHPLPEGHTSLVRPRRPARRHAGSDPGLEVGAGHPAQERAQRPGSSVLDRAAERRTNPPPPLLSLARPRLPAAVTVRTVPAPGERRPGPTKATSKHGSHSSLVDRDTSRITHYRDIAHCTARLSSRQPTRAEHRRRDVATRQPDPALDNVHLHVVK